MKGGLHMYKTYTTISGDTWDKIAHEQMGSVFYTDQLIRANVKYAAVFVFSAGITLTIPEVEQKINMELPPWKRKRLL
jgi:hypothetical protein